MEGLLTTLRTYIPQSSTRKWSYSIDLCHSCFRLENANMHSCTLSGYGGIEVDDLMVTIRVQVSVGKSNHIQVIEKKQRGLEKAIYTLFHLPQEAHVCIECGKVCLREEGIDDCPDCIFIKAFAEYKSIDETCSICQTKAYRTTLECGHFFHMTCLLSMSPVDAKCPNCRFPISEELLHDFYGDQEDYSDDEY